MIFILLLISITEKNELKMRMNDIIIHLFKFQSADELLLSKTETQGQFRTHMTHQIDRNCQINIRFYIPDKSISTTKIVNANVPSELNLICSFRYIISFNYHNSLLSNVLHFHLWLSKEPE
jgi:hypothetical protein